LVFVSAVAAAILAERWQVTRYQADAILACARRCLDSGRQLLTAMNFARNVLLAHQQQGHVWDFQRRDFVKFTREMRVAGFAITAAMSELRVLTPRLSAPQEQIVDSIGTADAASARVVAFVPTPTTPNARVAVLSPGQSLQTTIDAFLAASTDLSEGLDALVGATATQHSRLLRFQWGVLLLGAVVLAGACAAVWFSSWSHEISGDRVIWTHAISGRVEVVPLPGVGADSPRRTGPSSGGQPTLDRPAGGNRTRGVR
jgi:hypothetical protein